MKGANNMFDEKNEEFDVWVLELEKAYRYLEERIVIGKQCGFAWTSAFPLSSLDPTSVFFQRLHENLREQKRFVSHLKEMLRREGHVTVDEGFYGLYIKVPR
jgi:hypothetical protein